MLDHEHPQTTRRSHYRYMFTLKHHGGDGDGQWIETLTEDDEFAVFDEADEMDISDEHGNLYGALREGADSLRDLGTYDEQIAKFWKPPEGTPWHGYPVWSINHEGPGNRRRNPPPKIVFNKMVDVGLIRRAKANPPQGRTPYMNQLSELEFFPIKVPQDFDVCWAGPNLVDLNGGLCFGSTDGELLFLDIEGQPIVISDGRVRAPGRGSVSGEAINGVARVGTWVGVSTREEVNFWPLEGTPGGHTTGVVAPYGAHDITTTAQGYFVAPLGRNGIMVMQPPSDRSDRVKAFSSEETGLYAYRLAVVAHSSPGTEVIACATRRGGIVAGEFAVGQQTLNLRRAALPGFDAVDICPLDHGTGTRAIAALGRDGRLALFHDVLDNKKPITIKFRNVQGVPYRILTSHGDIHLLTSKGLFVLGELAGRFLRKELTSEVNTPVRTSFFEAVDANLVDNRWLLVVMPGMVAKYDLEVIHHQVLDHLDDVEIQDGHTMDGAVEWQWRDVPTTAKQVALAG